MKLVKRCNQSLPLWYRVGETLHMKVETCLCEMDIRILRVEECHHVKCDRRSSRCCRYNVYPILKDIGDDDGMLLYSCSIEYCKIYNDSKSKEVIVM